MLFLTHSGRHAPGSPYFHAQLPRGLCSSSHFKNNLTSIFVRLQIVTVSWFHSLDLRAAPRVNMARVRSASSRPRVLWYDRGRRQSLQCKGDRDVSLRVANPLVGAAEPGSVAAALGCRTRAWQARFAVPARAGVAVPGRSNRAVPRHQADHFHRHQYAGGRQSARCDYPDQQRRGRRHRHHPAVGRYLCAHHPEWRRRPGEQREDRRSRHHHQGPCACHCRHGHFGSKRDDHRRQQAQRPRLPDHRPGYQGHLQGPGDRERHSSGQRHRRRRARHHRSRGRRHPQPGRQGRWKAAPRGV